MKDLISLINIVNEVMKRKQHINWSIVLSSKNIVFDLNRKHQGGECEYYDVDNVVVLNSIDPS